MSDIKFAEKLISAIYFDFELCIHDEKTVRSEKWLNKMTGISIDFLVRSVVAFSRQSVTKPQLLFDRVPLYREISRRRH